MGEGDASLPRDMVIRASAADMDGESQIKRAKTAASDIGGQPAKIVRMRVADLLADTREAILEHNGQEYRLRITANGKLILTK